MYLDRLADEAMAFIHECAMARPDPSVLVHVPIMGGSTAAVAAEETAFGDRRPQFMLSFDRDTYDPDNFDEIRTWVGDTIEAARRLDGAGGAYLNFSGADSIDERSVRRQFGNNLDRLRATKQQYDPANLLRINNNIRPA